MFLLFDGLAGLLLPFVVDVGRLSLLLLLLLFVFDLPSSLSSLYVRCMHGFVAFSIPMENARYTAASEGKEAMTMNRPHCACGPQSSLQYCQNHAQRSHYNNVKHKFTNTNV